MARFKHRGGDADLRAALLAEAKSMLAFYLGHPWPLDGSDYEPTATEIAQNPFGGAVAALTAGEVVMIHRWSLPDWCADRHVGAPGDYLLLTEGNELEPYDGRRV